MAYCLAADEAPWKGRGGGSVVWASLEAALLGRGEWTCVLVHAVNSVLGRHVKGLDRDQGQCIGLQWLGRYCI